MNTAPQAAEQTPVVHEDISAHAVNSAYTRTLQALGDYRDILTSIGNEADQSYALNDLEEFDEIISEIRTVATRAAEANHDDDANAPREPL